jgi:hypothetical protein
MASDMTEIAATPTPRLKLLEAPL